MDNFGKKVVSKAKHDTYRGLDKASNFGKKIDAFGRKTASVGKRNIEYGLGKTSNAFKDITKRETNKLAKK